MHTYAHVLCKCNLNNFVIGLCGFLIFINKINNNISTENAY